MKHDPTRLSIPTPKTRRVDARDAVPAMARRTIRPARRPRSPLAALSLPMVLAAIVACLAPILLEDTWLDEAIAEGDDLGKLGAVQALRSVVDETLGAWLPRSEPDCID